MSVEMPKGYWMKVQQADNEAFFARSKEEWALLGGFPQTPDQVLDAIGVGRLLDMIEEERERWLQEEFLKDLKASGRLG